MENQVSEPPSLQLRIARKALQLAMTGVVNNCHDANGGCDEAVNDLCEFWTNIARDHIKAESTKQRVVRSHTCIECGQSFCSDHEELQWIHTRCPNCEYDDKYCYYGPSEEDTI